jgi:hypothetical protein
MTQDQYRYRDHATQDLYETSSPDFWVFTCPLTDFRLRMKTGVVICQPTSRGQNVEYSRPLQ